MYRVFFEEEQKFTSKWIWLLLSCMSIVFIYSLFEQIILHKSVGNNPMPDGVLVLIGVIPLITMYLFYKISLKTRIDSDGIYYQMYPFHRTERKIGWDEIDKIYVRKYRPIMEYGGWGYRVKFNRKDIAFNISGKMGLQIELKNGKKILIGTQCSEDIKRAILEMEYKM